MKGTDHSKELKFMKQELKKPLVILIALFLPMKSISVALKVNHPKHAEMGSNT